MLRRYALWLGLSGFAIYGLALWLIANAIIAPFDAVPLLFIGQAGIVSGIVLVVLMLIARRLSRLK